MNHVEHNGTSADNRLAYLTGLRGIAALVVAVGHTLGMVPPDHPRTSFFQADAYHKAIWPWLFGGQMVWLFLMVSGFALYWSEARRRRRSTDPTSFTVYVRRRFWRIAPTYYVAVLLGLLVLWLGSDVYVSPSPSLDTSVPISVLGVVSHLGLFHNLSGQWAYQINPPLWSIAVEVQLYLLFPLIMYLAGRFPLLVVVPIVLLVTRLIQYALGVPIFALAEFFLGGVVLAHVAESCPRIPHRVLSWVALSLIVLGLLRVPMLSGDWATRGIWFLAFSSLLVRLHQGPRVSFVTCRPLIFFGDRSYSLYAVHFPIALALWWFIERTGFSSGALALLMVLVSVPVQLMFVELCYRLVEKPSLRKVASIASMNRERSGGVSPRKVADGRSEIFS